MARRVTRDKVLRGAGAVRHRNFRLFWLGQAVSALGDQFTFVAIPWLALVLTGSGLALGSVLATMAVPRAALMLFGGVFVDRLSPGRALLVSTSARLLTVATLGLVVLAGSATLPVLYIASFVFGVADAFFFPAMQAIVPTLVPSDDLAAANALNQGTGQLTGLVGPGLAGVAIATLGMSGANPSMIGIGAALLIDAASFVVALVVLVLIAPRKTPRAARESLLRSVHQGIEFVWRWPSMRFVVGLAMGVNLLVIGPLNVGLPMLAYSRLAGGPADYGTLMSALAGGSLLGMVAVGALPRPRPAVLGTVVLAVLALMGVGLMIVSVVSSTFVAAIDVTLIGFAMGYANLSFITWAQPRVPMELMGRVFSVILLGSVALVPVSQVIAGALVGVSLSWTLAGAGAVMTAFTLLGALSPKVRGMGMEPARSPVPTAAQS
jgi:MFS family permease